MKDAAGWYTAWGRAHDERVEKLARLYQQHRQQLLQHHATQVLIAKEECDD